MNNPSPILSAPAALLAVLLAVLLAAPAPSAAMGTARQAVVYAVADGEPITELDLYLFLRMTGRDAAPLRGWAAAAEDGSETARRALAQLVREYLEVRVAAARITIPEDPHRHEKAVRSLAAEGARLVFADRVVAQRVEVSPLDIAQFYNRNKDQFARAASARIVRLRVPIEGRSAAEARERAEELRREAAAVGLEEVLRRHPRYAMVDGASQVVAIGPQTAAVNPLVREEAFRLPIGVVSRPIATSNAVLLVEVVEREAGEAAPLREVRGEIASILRDRFLEQQLAVQIGEEVALRRPIRRTAIYPSMDDDWELLRVGEWTLSKAEFDFIHPGWQGERDPVSDDFRDLVRSVTDGEVLVQALERDGLAADARFRRAQAVAGEVLRAREANRALRAAQEVGDDEVAAFLAREGDIVMPDSRAVVWRVELARTGAAIAPSAQDEARRRLAEELAIGLREAEAQLAERALLAGPGVLADPRRVVERALRSGDARGVLVQELGAFDADQAWRELALAIDEMPLGHFTDPRPASSASVESFYIGVRLAPPEVDEDALAQRARAFLLERRARQPITDEIARMEAAGRIVWRLPGGEAAP